MFESNPLKRVAALLLFCLGASSFPAKASAADLDYSRTISENGMIFVPYRGESRGQIFFTSFEQRLVGVSRGAGPLHRIWVELVPTAVARRQYEAFLRTHRVTDARVSATLGHAGACRPTDEIESLLAGMPQGYRPAIVGPNYPQVCSLSLHVLPEEVDDYLAIIADRPVITLSDRIQLCTPSSTWIPLTPLVTELVASGALARAPDGSYSGDLWTVLYEMTRLSERSPQLFSADARAGWKGALKRFTIDVTRETATLSAEAASGDALACTASELSLVFPASP